MEPERKIEKLLRAAAEKRRGEAGDAFKLHPANRRLLQGEVAARHPPARRADGFFTLLPGALRRRPAFALCVFGIVAAGLVFLLLPLAGRKNEATPGAMSSARTFKNSPDVISTPPPATAPVAESRQPEVATAASSPPAVPPPVMAAPAAKDKEKPLDVAASGELSRAPSETASFKGVTPAGETPAVQGETSQTASPKGATLELNDQMGLEPAKSKPAELEPAVAPTPAGGAGKSAPAFDSFMAAGATQSAGTVGQNRPHFGRFALQSSAARPALAGSRDFVQTFAPQNYFKNDLPAQTTPVLQSFQVQQNGNALSVVDRDGSVYNGSVQSGAGQAGNGPAVETPPGAVALRQTQTKAIQSMAQREQAVQNCFFRVAGLNRTLKQHVVFTGNVQQLTNTTAKARQNLNGNFSGGGGAGGAIAANAASNAAGNQNESAAAHAQQLGWWSNSRIVGTAVVGHTNRIEINAVPAAQ